MILHYILFPFVFVDMAQLMNVRLSRVDAQPWGLRLQGGKDFGTPLVVQKVSAIGLVFIRCAVLYVHISSVSTAATCSQKFLLNALEFVCRFTSRARVLAVKQNETTTKPQKKKKITTKLHKKKAKSRRTIITQI